MHEVIKNPQLPEWSQSRFDLYGFMGGQCKYTYDYSIQHIANFFQKHEDLLKESDTYKNFYNRQIYNK